METKANPTQMSALLDSQSDSVSTNANDTAESISLDEQTCTCTDDCLPASDVNATLRIDPVNSSSDIPSESVSSSSSSSYVSSSESESAGRSDSTRSQIGIVLDAASAVSEESSEIGLTRTDPDHSYDVPSSLLTNASPMTMKVLDDADTLPQTRHFLPDTSKSSQIDHVDATNSSTAEDSSTGSDTLTSTTTRDSNTITSNDSIPVEEDTALISKAVNSDEEGLSQVHDLDADNAKVADDYFATQTSTIQTSSIKLAGFEDSCIDRDPEKIHIVDDGGVDKLDPSKMSMTGTDFVIFDIICELVESPINRVQLILQTIDGNPSITSGRSIRHTGFLECFFHTYRTQGLLSFYRGALAHFIEVSLSRCIRDRATPLVRNVFPCYDPKKHYYQHFTVNLVSSTLAAAVYLFASQPFSYAYVHLSADVEAKDAFVFQGLFTLLWKMGRHPSDVAKIYASYMICPLGALVYRLIFFGLYEYLSLLIHPRALGQSGFKRGFAIAQLTAFIAYLGAYPFDTVRKLTQLSSSEGSGDASALNWVYRVWNTSGIHGFYKGAGIRVVTTCTSFLLMTAYSSMKRAMLSIRGTSNKTQTFNKFALKFANMIGPCVQLNCLILTYWCVHSSPWIYRKGKVLLDSTINELFTELPVFFSTICSVAITESRMIVSYFECIYRKVESYTDLKDEDIRFGAVCLSALVFVYSVIREREHETIFRRAKTTLSGIVSFTLQWTFLSCFLTLLGPWLYQSVRIFGPVIRDGDTSKLATYVFALRKPVDTFYGILLQAQQQGLNGFYASFESKSIEDFYLNKDCRAFAVCLPALIMGGIAIRCILQPMMMRIPSGQQSRNNYLSMKLLQTVVGCTLSVYWLARLGSTWILPPVDTVNAIGHLTRLASDLSMHIYASDSLGHVTTVTGLWARELVELLALCSESMLAQLAELLTSVLEAVQGMAERASASSEDLYKAFDCIYRVEGNRTMIVCLLAMLFGGFTIKYLIQPPSWDLQRCGFSLAKIRSIYFNVSKRVSSMIATVPTPSEQQIRNNRLSMKLMQTVAGYTLSVYWLARLGSTWIPPMDTVKAIGHLTRLTSDLSTHASDSLGHVTTVTGLWAREHVELLALCSESMLAQLADLLTSMRKVAEGIAEDLFRVAYDICTSSVEYLIKVASDLSTHALGSLSRISAITWLWAREQVNLLAFYSESTLAKLSESAFCAVDMAREHAERALVFSDDVVRALGGISRDAFEYLIRLAFDLSTCALDSMNHVSIAIELWARERAMSMVSYSESILTHLSKTVISMIETAQGIAGWVFVYCEEVYSAIEDIYRVEGNRTVIICLLMLLIGGFTIRYVIQPPSWVLQRDGFSLTKIRSIYDNMSKAIASLLNWRLLVQCSMVVYWCFHLRFMLIETTVAAVSNATLAIESLKDYSSAVASTTLHAVEGAMDILNLQLQLLIIDSQNILIDSAVSVIDTMESVRRLWWRTEGFVSDLVQSAFSEITCYSSAIKDWIHAVYSIKGVRAVVICSLMLSIGLYAVRKLQKTRHPSAESASSFKFWRAEILEMSYILIRISLLTCLIYLPFEL